MLKNSLYSLIVCLLLIGCTQKPQTTDTVKVA